MPSARRNSRDGPIRENMRKRFLYLLLVISLFFPPGCAELRTTARIMNTALIELFRLPIYVLRLPFQLIQSLGPMLRAAMTSAANMAPLLLFIERQAPRDALYAGAAAPYAPGDGAARADGVVRSLLPVLDGEIAEGAPVRFTLVDARLLKNRRLREALCGNLGGGGKRVRCVTVDAGDVFADRERFLQICSRMRARGDSLFALTAFNDDLAALVDAASGGLPAAPADRDVIMRWEGVMEGIAADN